MVTELMTGGALSVKLPLNGEDWPVVVLVAVPVTLNVVATVIS
jgi:hypothetical protein